MIPASVAILAIAEGSVVMTIVLVISVISWIVNLIQGNNPKGGKPAKPAGEANPQSELERFLQEVVGAKPAPEPEKKRPPQQKPARAADKRTNKPKQQRPPASQRPANPQRPAASQRPAADRPGARLAQSHLAPMAGAGEGTRSFAPGSLATPNLGSLRGVDAGTSAPIREGGLRQGIGSSIERDMGVDGTTISVQRASVHPLIQALRNPQGVRQAIVLSEILNRPRSLR